ncbi:MAG TPA: PQQ-dependent sugar dehydrogenase [Acidimicrobiia bacterium]|nr:PQQ-dependent sugar dehydrogenase [Acidimicrobiia bacterium]
MTVRRTAVAAVVVAGTALGAISSPARAADPTPRVSLTRVAKLTGTTAMASRAGDDALYVAQQDGRVWAIRNGRVASQPALDISADTIAAGEQGLLGLAFSPDGTLMYVDYTDRSGDSHIEAFTMKGNVADPSTRRLILFVKQPEPNHNGGQLAFGPDGDLYIGFGDGGSEGDQGFGHARGGNGQSLHTRLGKILRIDPTPSSASPYRVPPDNPFVGRKGVKPEIWAYGLRNPWRFSFDAETGDLWIGDVGQDKWEEVDFVPATNGRDAGRGDNFGWDRLEGTHPYKGRAPAGAVPPVYETSHADGNCAITGGFVYRGTAIPDLRGMYLVTDYCRGRLTALQPTGDGSFQARDLGITLTQVSSFGQANDHELYVLSQSSGVYEITPG